MLTQIQLAKQQQRKAVNFERSGSYAIAKRLYSQAVIIWGRVPVGQSNKHNCTIREKHCEAMAQQLHTKASKLNSLVVVQSRVELIRSKLSKQTEEEFNITVSDLKKMLVMAAQGGLKKKSDPQGNEVLHSIPGAVSAIAELNRMDGNHAPTKQDHTSSDGSLIHPGYAIVNE